MALEERGGWGLSPRGESQCGSTPAQPSPASGRGSATSMPLQHALHMRLPCGLTEQLLSDQRLRHVFATDERPRELDVFEHQQC